jgi:hypothetical protein
MWQRVATVVLACLVSTGGVVAVTAAPAAAASCYSTSCNWVDPQSSGCATANNQLDEFTSEARVILRYSPTCNSVWTKWVLPCCVGGLGNYGSCPSKVYIQAKYNLSDSGYAINWYMCLPTYTESATSGWTPMVSFSYWVRSCSQWLSQALECTSWH